MLWGYGLGLWRYALERCVKGAQAKSEIRGCAVFGWWKGERGRGEV